MTQNSNIDIDNNNTVYLKNIHIVSIMGFFYAEVNLKKEKTLKKSGKRILVFLVFIFDRYVLNRSLIIVQCVCVQ